MCEEKKISFEFSSPFEIFLQSFSDVHVILNFTVMYGGTKKLEVFILHDLCCEVFI